MPGIIVLESTRRLRLKIQRMVHKITDVPNLELQGFLVHAGQAYEGRSVKEVEEIHRDYTSKYMEVKAQYPELKISIGDSPTCSLMSDFPGANELRPGVFVFYDLMQYQIGACELNQIALALACPVVSVLSRSGWRC